MWFALKARIISDIFKYFKAYIGLRFLENQVSKLKNILKLYYNFLFKSEISLLKNKTICVLLKNKTII